MRDCNIVILYKNQLDRSKFNSYRGIYLLDCAWAVLACGFLGRLLYNNGYISSLSVVSRRIVQLLT